MSSPINSCVTQGTATLRFVGENAGEFDEQAFTVNVASYNPLNYRDEPAENGGLRRLKQNSYALFTIDGVHKINEHDLLSLCGVDVELTFANQQKVIIWSQATVSLDSDINAVDSTMPIRISSEEKALVGPMA